MNIVHFENCAFIFPDDMETWRKRYAADVICIDAEAQEIWVIGPNDTEWREVPADIKPEGSIVAIRGKRTDG